MAGNLEKSIISPATASGLVQSGFDAINEILPLGAVFPVKSNGGEKVVRWNKVVPAVKSEIVEFRAWDGEAGHGKNVTVSDEEYTGLIPLSKMSHISEYDIVNHSGDAEWLRSHSEQEFVRLGREAAARIELARIALLKDAKITVSENGIKGNTWTFERPSALSNLKPATSWDDDKSDPFTDIRKWRDKMKQQYGRPSQAAITTTSVIDALCTNEWMRTKFANTSITYAPARLDREEVLQVLASSCGLRDVRMIDDLYSNLEYEHKFRMPVDDMSTLIGEGTFIMFPAFHDTGLGFTASGPTAEAGDPSYEINKTVNDGFIGAMYSSSAPVKYDLWVNGTMMPILQEAVSTMNASVLS